MRARDDEDREIERLVETRLLRVNALSFGIVAGLVAGLGLFVATNWLVLKGGMHGGHSHDIGPHLSHATELSFDLLSLLRIDHWTQIHIGTHWIAQPQRARELDKFIDEFRGY